MATDEKNEVIKVEWIFTCETNDLAKEWETLINQYKAQKLKATEAKNALSFVHGVIADELSPTLPINKLLNESILKPEEIGPVK